MAVLGTATFVHQLRQRLMQTEMLIFGHNGKRLHERRIRGNALDEGDWTGKWRPALGAWPDKTGMRFRVWAPEKQKVELVIEGPESRVYELERYQDGTG